VRTGHTRSTADLQRSKNDERRKRTGPSSSPGHSGYRLSGHSPFSQSRQQHPHWLSNYGQAITEQYTTDAGVEHAIWRLTNDGLADELSSPGDGTTYQLSETINNIVPTIIVTRINSSCPLYAFRGGGNSAFWRYDIRSSTWTAMADAPANVGDGGAFTNEIGASYEIVSTAGDSTVRAEVQIADGGVSVLSWQVD